MENPQKTQMNTELHAGHTDNRAPAGLALFLGGQAGGRLAENTMVRVQVEKRQTAEEMSLTAHEQRLSPSLPAKPQHHSHAFSWFQCAFSIQ